MKTENLTVAMKPIDSKGNSVGVVRDFSCEVVEGTPMEQWGGIAERFAYEHKDLFNPFGLVTVCRGKACFSIRLEKKVVDGLEKPIFVCIP